MLPRSLALPSILSKGSSVARLYACPSCRRLLRTRSSALPRRHGRIQGGASRVEVHGKGNFPGLTFQQILSAEKDDTADMQEVPTRPYTVKTMRHSTKGGLQYEATRDEMQRMIVAEKFFRYGRDAGLLYSAESIRDHRHNLQLPEVIVLGASNVGKSSFLNALLSKPGAARVSAKPGHTKLMNAFGVGPPTQYDAGLPSKHAPQAKYSMVIIDTPGYGFRSRKSWGESITKYIQNRRMLRGAILLLSSEKQLQDHDKWILQSLAERNVHVQVVLTKADKGRADWASACVTLAQSLHEEFGRLEGIMTNGWKEGSGWASHIHITAVGPKSPHAVSNSGGVGGLRLAILNMAGFSVDEQSVDIMAEAVTYSGPIVAFDDIVWAR